MELPASQTMRRIKLIVEYDGSGFSGLQTQKKGERTVQADLEAALSKIPGAHPKVVPAGRTDAGVHALAMPFHYDTRDSVPTERIPAALNTLLDPDLRVLEAQEVASSFHARNSCCWRHYRYRILKRKTPSALDRHRVWWVPQDLNVTAMKSALTGLVGVHDFKVFAVREKRSTVREIFQALLLSKKDELWLEFVGSGFLRGQVRSMVGTLVKVGLDKRDPDSIGELLKSGTRQHAGPTAPPHGLYFVQAGYTPWRDRV
ncbi:MAG: tRNA pseudouridine(38-40) synthase TruA [Deinococcus sp.]|nr:tRNA pseudouridine(38-40) synthase TruA [Deinococcus sp.]MCL5965121.1 tRNA pseudouridine(38-40) synthase TruA [Deinococcus sp.]